MGYLGLFQFGSGVLRSEHEKGYHGAFRCTGKLAVHQDRTRDGDDTQHWHGKAN